MSNNELICTWLAYERAAGTPKTTLRMRVHYVERVARHHDLLAVTAEELIEWFAAHEWSPNTRKTVRSSLRSFYRWAVATGRVSVSPAEALPTVRVPRGVAKPTPEAVYRAALADGDERLALMVALAGKLGLRRAEIARVRREDLTRTLYGYSLRVQGKGGHTRVIPVDDELARRLRRQAPGWVFYNTTTGTHLSADYVGKLLSRVLPVGYSGHSLRHRCGSAAYAATRDLLAVQELLGHARPETTRGYIALPDDALRAAVVAAAA